MYAALAYVRANVREDLMSDPRIGKSSLQLLSNKEVTIYQHFLLIPKGII